MTHYLTMPGSRSGQLARYVLAIAHGSPPLEAAQSAFGDLKQLDKDLNGYLNQRMIQAVTIGAAHIRPAPVDVRPLSPGASQLILLRSKMKYGLPASDLEAVAAQIRAIDARFPSDELVETTLAEAELDSNNASAAEAAADRALKANPQNTEAMILKGRAIAERADLAEDSSRHALFEEARHTLIAANKLDTEDPEPLYEFYKTFLKEGVRPTDNALAALHYASDLAPQDFGVRMTSAVAYLNEDKTKEARQALTVVAYSPHSGSVGEAARQLIAGIDAGKGRAALFELRRSSTEQSSPH